MFAQTHVLRGAIQVVFALTARCLNRENAAGEEDDWRTGEVKKSAARVDPI